MNTPDAYYEEKLYPFQVGILNLVKKLNTPFYLTGGAALCRGYFHHWRSDDLGLFMNRRDDYPTHVKTLYAELESRHHRGEFTLDFNPQDLSVSIHVNLVDPIVGMILAFFRSEEFSPASISGGNSFFDSSITDRE